MDIIFHSCLIWLQIIRTTQINRHNQYANFSKHSMLPGTKTYVTILSQYPNFPKHSMLPRTKTLNNVMVSTVKQTHQQKNQNLKNPNKQCRSRESFYGHSSMSFCLTLATVKLADLVPASHQNPFVSLPHINTVCRCKSGAVRFRDGNFAPTRPAPHGFYPPCRGGGAGTG